MTALRLGVNVDQSRPSATPGAARVPDPVRAALLAIEAGADGITAHLREDRRHIHDDDMRRLKAAISKPLNFEMAATEAMLDIALSVRPHACCLVPEKRTERTTEGGLDVVGGTSSSQAVRRRIEPRRHAGVDVHRTFGRGADARRVARAGGRTAHRGLVRRAGRGDERNAAITNSAACGWPPPQTAALGLECHAGHGLDYNTARTIAALPADRELNIGHFLIGEAIFVGLAESVRQMRAAMAKGGAGRNETERCVPLSPCGERARGKGSRAGLAGATLIRSLRRPPLPARGRRSRDDHRRRQ